MKNNDEIVIIPFGDNANLRIRKDQIIATVNVPGSEHIDVYVNGVANPWHITGVPADAIVGLIWGGDDD